MYVMIKDFCYNYLSEKNILIEEQEGYIVRLSFCENTYTKYTSLLKEAYSQLNAYLIGDLKDFDLPLKPKVSDFTKSVLIEMKKIPYGEVITYGELAKRVECKGVRAVGSACGRNPIPIIIPCHRIVAKNSIGGFTSGINIKKILMKIENINIYENN